MFSCMTLQLRRNLNDEARMMHFDLIELRYSRPVKSELFWSFLVKTLTKCALSYGTLGFSGNTISQWENVPLNKMSAAAGLENMLVDNGRAGRKDTCHWHTHTQLMKPIPIYSSCSSITFNYMCQVENYSIQLWESTRQLRSGREKNSQQREIIRVCFSWQLIFSW